MTHHFVYVTKVTLPWLLLSLSPDGICSCRQCDWTEADRGWPPEREDSAHGTAHGPSADHTAMDHQVCVCVCVCA